MPFVCCVLYWAKSVLLKINLLNNLFFLLLLFFTHFLEWFWLAIDSVKSNSIMNEVTKLFSSEILSCGRII